MLDEQNWVEIMPNSLLSNTDKLAELDRKINHQRGHYQAYERIDQANPAFSSALCFQCLII
eukprot:snap_masked-scaffold_16-processed-gene-6.75-mRNA-1 protein AED:1.00 eAED:1.00 QI:0/-1/0/0/-1/1/1/0/60